MKPLHTRRFLLPRPCPSCGDAHGHSPWRVANSSVIKPLRCTRCGHNFHQTGLGVWLWVGSVLPTSFAAALLWALTISLLPGLHAGTAFLAATAVSGVLEVLGVLIYVNRRKPLAVGPRYG